MEMLVSNEYILLRLLAVVKDVMHKRHGGVCLSLGCVVCRRRPTAASEVDLEMRGFRVFDICLMRRRGTS